MKKDFSKLLLNIGDDKIPTAAGPDTLNKKKESFLPLRGSRLKSTHVLPWLIGEFPGEEKMYESVVSTDKEEDAKDAVTPPVELLN